VVAVAGYTAVLVVFVAVASNSESVVLASSKALYLYSRFT
jgi:hypothetical protein